MDKQMQVTSIGLKNYHAAAIEDAIYTVKMLFDTVPAECRSDLELLSSAYADLTTISKKVVDEPGFEKLYLLERGGAENG